MKTSPLKSKSSLKRKSPDPRRILKDKADRALQDWYRDTYPEQLCEACGERIFDIMHHFVPKSMSFFLRFNKKNLVFLCNACHYKHHNTGDPTIHALILFKRGEKWFNWIEKAKRISIPFSRKIMREQIEKYKL